MDPTNNVLLALDYTPRAYYSIPSAPGQFTRMLESIEKALRNVQELDIAGIGQGVTNALGAVTASWTRLTRSTSTALPSLRHPPD